MWTVSHFVEARPIRKHYVLSQPAHIIYALLARIIRTPPVRVLVVCSGTTVLILILLQNEGSGLSGTSTTSTLEIVRYDTATGVRTRCFMYGNSVTHATQPAPTLSDGRLSAAAACSTHAYRVFSECRCQSEVSPGLATAGSSSRRDVYKS